MNASGPGAVAALLAVFAAVLAARSGGGTMAITQREDYLEEEVGHHVHRTTQDTDRDATLVTTASPFNVPNHHPHFEDFLPHESFHTDLQDHPHYFEDSGGVTTHSSMPASISHMAEGLSTKEPHEFIAATSTRVSTLPASAESLTTVTLTSTPPSCSSSPNVVVPVGQGDVIKATTLKPPVTPVENKDMETKESKVEKHNWPNSDVTTATASLSRNSDDESDFATTFPTMNTPAPCHANLTAPEGLIESPPQAGSWSTVDCSYSVTAYMGYGVEIQVMNVSLAQGDTVTFEDLGGREPSVLANESILMKGLVVRSWSNQIGIRFHSSRPKPGHFQLRYQAYILSCPFPGRPMYGDVSVTSLHAGGEAFFYCFTGYQLQGPSTLTCYNATMPYWSGREPQCLAACGGVVRNATVGRIVSPGFPGNYSNNLTCHWVLESPEGRRLHIHFEKVALAEDDDRLLIKNGNHIDSPPLYDSYEVEYLPNEGLTSSSRFLFIELTTDGSGTSTGAALRYEAFGPGHCYEPFVKYGNFTSSDSSYAVGAVVEFTCDPGYTLEQGSVIIECMDPNNPQWNETEPACRAVCSGEITDSAGVVLSPNWPEAYDKGQDCIWGIHVEEDKRIMLDIQVLHMGTNDLLTFYDGDDLTAKILGQYGGSRPRFKLYTTTADVTLQFQSDPATNIYGYNNGFVVNFFEVPRNDTCPELPEITNGWKTTSHPELVHGTVVTYQCYPGFEVVGTETLMCQWDLTWSGDLPSCEKMLSCSDPGLVEHSRRVMSGPRLTVGSTVQYICSKGYLLSGNSLLTCYHRDSSGPKWTEKLPKCVPETFDPCQNPGTPSFSTQSPQKRLYQAGETLRFSCQRGYELMGEPLMRCIPGHPSRWSNSPPVCKGTPEEYINERRLDVPSTQVTIEGVSVAIAVFIPVAIVVIVVLGIYLYFSRIQGKSLQFAVSTSSRYEHIGAEAAYDNPAYENTCRRQESMKCLYRAAFSALRDSSLSLPCGTVFLAPSFSPVAHPLYDFPFSHISLATCCK
uniref:Uncharacterized protein n=2 Tax=Denticeps clupeoides TaxID=299321 RepID=A0AAY4DTH4_9TELE